MRTYPCSNCGATEAKGQWWSLSKYHGLSGRFCPKCYNKVSHDSYGMPEHPKAYAEILAKQTG